MQLCEMCVREGVDFVKTSTGFGPGGATPEAVKVMRRTINELGSASRSRRAEASRPMPTPAAISVSAASASARPSTRSCCHEPLANNRGYLAGAMEKDATNGTEWRQAIQLA